MRSLLTKNIVLTHSQFDIDNVFFCEPNANNIMQDGSFIRLLFSNDLFTTNGIYLQLPIHITSIEKYFNKYKYNFDVNSNLELIENISNIEQSILDKIHIDKKSFCKIQSQLKNGNIKMITNNTEISNHILLLKISGIWETDMEYGITYKFISVKKEDH